MIGIDITQLSRFRRFSESKIDRLAEKFNTKFSSHMEAAKWWACHEAIIKCLGRPPQWTESSITFPPNSTPKYTGKEKIHLSLSHEGDLVLAVAILDR